MGTANVIMNVQTADNFVGQLKALGDDVAMDTEEGGTHEMTCIESYTTGQLDWVFGHVRGTSTSVGNLSGGETGVIERCYYSIDGNKVEKTRPALVYIMKETLANGKTRCRKVHVQQQKSACTTTETSARLHATSSTNKQTDMDK